MSDTSSAANVRNEYRTKQMVASVNLLRKYDKAVHLYLNDKRASDKSAAAAADHQKSKQVDYSELESASSSGYDWGTIALAAAGGLLALGGAAAAVSSLTSVDPVLLEASTKTTEDANAKIKEDFAFMPDEHVDNIDFKGSVVDIFDGDDLISQDLAHKLYDAAGMSTKPEMVITHKTEKPPAGSSKRAKDIVVRKVHVDDVRQNLRNHYKSRANQIISDNYGWKADVNVDAVSDDDAVDDANIKDLVNDDGVVDDGLEGAITEKMKEVALRRLEDLLPKEYSKKDLSDYEIPEEVYKDLLDGDGYITSKTIESVLDHVYEHAGVGAQYAAQLKKNSYDDGLLFGKKKYATQDAFTGRLEASIDKFNDAVSETKAFDKLSRMINDAMSEPENAEKLKKLLKENKDLVRDINDNDSKVSKANYDAIIGTLGLSDFVESLPGGSSGDDSAVSDDGLTQIQRVDEMYSGHKRKLEEKRITQESAARRSKQAQQKSEALKNRFSKQNAEVTEADKTIAKTVIKNVLPDRYKNYIDNLELENDDVRDVLNGNGYIKDSLFEKLIDYVCEKDNVPSEAVAKIKETVNKSWFGDENIKHSELGRVLIDNDSFIKKSIDEHKSYNILSKMLPFVPKDKINKNVKRVLLDSQFSKNILDGNQKISVKLYNELSSHLGVDPVIIREDTISESEAIKNIRDGLERKAITKLKDMSGVEFSNLDDVNIVAINSSQKLDDVLEKVSDVLLKPWSNFVLQNNGYSELKKHINNMNDIEKKDIIKGYFPLSKVPSDITGYDKIKEAFKKEGKVPTALIYYASKLQNENSQLEDSDSSFFIKRTFDIPLDSTIYKPSKMNLSLSDMIDLSNHDGKISDELLSRLGIPPDLYGTASVDENMKDMFIKSKTIFDKWRYEPLNKRFNINLKDFGNQVEKGEVCRILNDAGYANVAKNIEKYDRKEIRKSDFVNIMKFCTGNSIDTSAELSNNLSSFLFKTRGIDTTSIKMNENWFKDLFLDNTADEISLENAKELLSVDNNAFLESFNNVPIKYLDDLKVLLLNKHGNMSNEFRNYILNKVVCGGGDSSCIVGNYVDDNVLRAFINNNDIKKDTVKNLIGIEPKIDDVNGVDVLELLKIKNGNFSNEITNNSINKIFGINEKTTFSASEVKKIIDKNIDTVLAKKINKNIKLPIDSNIELTLSLDEVQNVEKLIQNPNLITKIKQYYGIDFTSNINPLKYLLGEAYNTDTAKIILQSAGFGISSDAYLNSLNNYKDVFDNIKNINNSIDSIYTGNIFESSGYFLAYAQKYNIEELLKQNKERIPIEDIKSLINIVKTQNWDHEVPISISSIVGLNDRVTYRTFHASNMISSGYNTKTGVSNTVSFVVYDLLGGIAGWVGDVLKSFVPAAVEKVGDIASNTAEKGGKAIGKTLEETGKGLGDALAGGGGGVGNAIGGLIVGGTNTAHGILGGAHESITKTNDKLLASDAEKTNKMAYNVVGGLYYNFMAFWNGANDGIKSVDNRLAAVNPKKQRTGEPYLGFDPAKK